MSKSTTSNLHLKVLVDRSIPKLTFLLVKNLDSLSRLTLVFHERGGDYIGLFHAHTLRQASTRLVSCLYNPLSDSHRLLLDLVKLNLFTIDIWFDASITILYLPFW